MCKAELQNLKEIMEKVSTNSGRQTKIVFLKLLVSPAISKELESWPFHPYNKEESKQNESKQF